MILTLTTPTEPYARAMSGLLWTLATTTPGTTSYAVGWLTHPVSGDAALSIPDSYRQRVAPDADIATFAAALPIPQAERDALALVLEGARGKELEVSALLPPTLAAHALTDAEAKAAGWFASDDL